MSRISRMGVMLALAGLLSGLAACTPAMGQTAPAVKKDRAGYTLPWLRKPKATARPPLPARKPAKPEAPAQPETTAAKPLSGFDTELVHTGIKPAAEPAPPPGPQAKPAETEATAAMTPEPEQQAAAAPAPLRKPAGETPAAPESEPKTVIASGTAGAEPPTPDRKPSPAPARKESTGQGAAKKDTARILPAQPDADAKAESKPAAARTAHAAAPAAAPLPDRKPPKPALRPAKADGGTQSARPGDKDKDEDSRQAARNKTRKELCLALRGCRNDYTRCFNRLEKEVKPELWSAEREKCVAAYKICIDKNFKAGEMWFTRWFTPFENCE